MNRLILSVFFILGFSQSVLASATPSLANLAENNQWDEVYGALTASKGCSSCSAGFKYEFEASDLNAALATASTRAATAFPSSRPQQTLIQALIGRGANAQQTHTDIALSVGSDQAIAAHKVINQSVTTALAPPPSPMRTITYGSTDHTAPLTSVSASSAKTTDDPDSDDLGGAGSDSEDR